MREKNIFALIVCSLFIFSCASPNHELRSDGAIAGGPVSVDWEPKPRAIGSGSGPQLWVRASEAMIMLYSGFDKEGKQDLFLAGSHDMGDSFSKPILINTEPGEVKAHGENDPHLKKGKNSEIYTLWEGGQDLKFARSINFGKSFTEPIRINDDKEKASHSFSTMEVAPDGTIYVAWLDGRDKKTNMSGTSSLFIARSTDKGKTFERNIKVAGNICPCCRPAMTFGSAGEIFLTWRHVYENDERFIVVSSSLDGGTTWSAPVQVSKKGWKLNGCAHSGPVVGYVGGKLIVVWFTAEDGKAVLKSARSADNGRTFADVELLNGRVLDANHPHLAIIGDDAWVVFQGRDPDTGGGWDPQKTWLIRVSAEGKPSTPSALPSTGGGVFYPRIFPGTGERIYVTWTEMGESGSKLVLCRGRIHK